MPCTSSSIILGRRQKFAIDITFIKLARYWGTQKLNDKEIMTNSKVLFATAVEDALNGMGGPTLEMVNHRLFQKYKCSVQDCLEHPEYLKTVLHDVFGYADIAVIAKIKKNLGEFSQEQPVGEFLKVLTK